MGLRPGPPLQNGPGQATPFDAARAFVRLNIRARSAWLAIGALTSEFDRERFERPALNDAAVAVEAAYALVRRFRRTRLSGRHDRSIAWADFMVDATACTLVAAAAGRDDQVDMLTNWMFSICIFDVADAGLQLDPREAVLIGILTTISYATIVLHRSRGSARSAIPANVVQLPVFAAIGILVARILRRGEAEFEAVQTRYRTEQALSARQVEIEVAQRHLLKAVQDAAADIRSLLSTDQQLARQRAAAIATELRSVLAKSDDHRASAFTDAVHAAIIDAASAGLTVQASFKVSADVDPVVAEPIVAALRAALSNISQYAQTDRAILRVVVDPQLVQLTLRDRGRGCDGLDPSQLRSVWDPLEDLTAQIAVTSTEDSGTKVTLQVRQ